MRQVIRAMQPCKQAQVQVLDPVLEALMMAFPRPSLSRSMSTSSSRRDRQQRRKH